MTLITSGRRAGTRGMGGGLYIPSSSPVLAVWDDPASLVGGNTMVHSAGSIVATLSGDVSPPPDIYLKCSAAGVVGGGTAMLQISYDGGANYASPVAMQGFHELANGYTVTFSGGTATLNAVWRPSLISWLDKTANARNLVAPSANVVVPTTLGPLGSRVPARLNGGASTLGHSSLRALFATFNSPLAFYMVTRAATSVNTSFFGIGTTANNCALTVSSISSNKYTVEKSLTVGSSTRTMTSTASRVANSFQLFIFSTDGTTGQMWVGMSGSLESATWSGTTGSAFNTGNPHLDGVYAAVGPSTSDSDIAAFALHQATYSTGDVSAIRDSVRDRWGSLVV